MEAGEATSFASLPYEVVFYILKNLPAKTLLRCRCVCRDWNSITTSQSFVNAHLLSQPDGYLFSHYFEPWYPSSSTSDIAQLCSFFPDDSFSPVHKFKVPLPYSSEMGPCRILVGSVNGLICLTDWTPFGRKLHLWNPTIRKIKTLANTSFKGKHHQRFFHPKTNVVFGLGLRAPTNDYTIVRIALFQWRSRRLKGHPPPQAEAYSMSTDSWKKVDISEDLSTRLMGFTWPYACVNGELNWVATFADGEGRSYRSILSCNVDKEEFRETKLPIDCRDITGAISVRIADYRGLLAVIVYGDSTPDGGNDHVWLWVMKEQGKEDSWRKRRIETRGVGTFTYKGCALDKIIIYKKGDGSGNRAEVVDMETLQLHTLSVSDFQFAHAFKETLLSLRPPHLQANTESTPAKYSLGLSLSPQLQTFRVIGNID